MTNKNKLTGFFGFILALFLTAAMVSCKKNNYNEIVTPPAPPAVRPDINFYGLTDDNRIIKYNAKTAEAPTSTTTITGLQPTEKLLSIDFRPATGQLYALGNTSRIYTINLNSGAATAVGTTSFTPALTGNFASIDFNPTVDRLRIVTSNGQNCCN